MINSEKVDIVTILFDNIAQIAVTSQLIWQVIILFWILQDN